jgi:hypothetical protein
MVILRTDGGTEVQTDRYDEFNRCFVTMRMCQKVAAFLTCGMLYPVLACTVIQYTVMEKVWKDLTQLYIRKMFDQIEGPIEKVFKMWGGTVAFEMRLHQ